MDEPSLGLPHECTAKYRIEVAVGHANERHHLVDFQPRPADHLEHAGAVAVWLSSHNSIPRDCFLVQVNVELSACLGRFLTCEDKAFGEGLDLLSQFFVEMPNVRVEIAVVLLIHLGQMM